LGKYCNSVHIVNIPVYNYIIVIITCVLTSLFQRYHGLDGFPKCHNGAPHDAVHPPSSCVTHIHLIWLRTPLKFTCRSMFLREKSFQGIRIILTQKFQGICIFPGFFREYTYSLSESGNIHLKKSRNIHIP